jgi:hypothetical protein
LNSILKEGFQRENPRICRLVCRAGRPIIGGMLLGYARVSKGDDQTNTLQARWACPGLVES